LKITDVRTFVMGTSWRNLIFVKVFTDEGITGVGEATLQNLEGAVLAYIEGAKRRHVIGSDPLRIEDLWLRMFKDDFWRGGVVPYTGLSAIEIACWDILGKKAGLPVYSLLGGLCHDKIKAYANGWYTVGRSPEQFAERAQAVKQRGYLALKVDPFGPGHYELDRVETRRSVELVDAIRQAVGEDVEVMIEGHGRFSPHTAIEIAKKLEPYEPSWFEEPVPPDNVKALMKVAKKTRIPIAAGERAFTRYGFRELLESNAVDIIQPDLIHAGGILETKKIAAMADAYYVTVAPHNSNGPVCTAVSAQLDSCTPNFRIQETFDDFSESYVREAVKGAYEIEDGYLIVPKVPGLGIEIDEEIVAEHPPQPVHFNLWKDNWQYRKSDVPK
jgi:galactonate dehydratase